jgi:hypothetical protein
VVEVRDKRTQWKHAHCSVAGTAVLAISMLILGLVAGVLGAWWMWKRNRGIPYQIYE